MKYFPEGTKVSRPSGGHVLWIEMPEDIDSLDLYEKSLKRIAYPALAFTDRMEIDLGDQKVELIYIRPSHTDGSILVYLPEKKVLFAGDILFTNYHPFLGEGNIEEWVKVLDYIMTMDVEKIILGHGPISTKKDIEEMKDYLIAFDKKARELAAKSDNAEHIASEIKKIAASETRRRRAYTLGYSDEVYKKIAMTVYILPMLLILLTSATSEAFEMDKLKQNLILTIKYLSHDIGQRSYLDMEKLNRTADYIEDRFHSYGCNVKRQPFNYRGSTYYNIICEIKGTKESKDGILVVGAHYDTVIDTPGADDNASGVAGLLELARLTVLKPLQRTVRFVAFTLEEPPIFMTKNMGSYIYANSLKDERIKVYGFTRIRAILLHLWETSHQGHLP